MNKRGAQFFQAVRAQVPARPDQRWFAGVCAAIAGRVGLDPLLVRAVTVPLVIIFPLFVSVYGLAWLLLPDERDGRILAEEALHLRFSTPQAFALVCLLLGSVPSPVWGQALVTWSASFTAVAVAGIAIGAWWMLSGREQAAAAGPPANAPTAPGSATSYAGAPTTVAFTPLAPPGGIEPSGNQSGTNETGTHETGTIETSTAEPDTPSTAGMPGTGGGPGEPGTPSWDWSATDQPPPPPLYTAPARQPANFSVAFAVLGGWALGVAVLWGLSAAGALPFTFAPHTPILVWILISLIAGCGLGMIINGLLWRRSVGLAIVGTLATIGMITFPTYTSYVVASDSAAVSQSWMPVDAAAATSGFTGGSGNFIVNLAHIKPMPHQEVKVPVSFGNADVQIILPRDTKVVINANMIGQFNWDGEASMVGIGSGQLFQNNQPASTNGTIAMDLRLSLGRVTVDYVQR